MSSVAGQVVSPCRSPALGGNTIPVSHTSSQVELDQALQPLNGAGRHALGTMIDQFNQGFADLLGIMIPMSNGYWIPMTLLLSSGPIGTKPHPNGRASGGDAGWQCPDDVIER